VKPDVSPLQRARELIDAAANDVERHQDVRIDPDARAALVDAMAEKADVLASLNDPARRAEVTKAATAIFSRGSLVTQEKSFASDATAAAGASIRASTLLSFKINWPWPIGTA
jgi:hypothetical protein